MGKVYIIEAQSTEMIKIGWANDPRKRLRELQTGNADKLELVAYLECGKMARSVESNLHRKYAKDREHGEWFSLWDGDLRELIEWMQVFGGELVDTDHRLFVEKEDTNHRISTGSIFSKIRERAADGQPELYRGGPISTAKQPERKRRYLPGVVIDRGDDDD